MPARFFVLYLSLTFTATSLSSATLPTVSSVARLTELITWRSCDDHARQVLFGLNSDLFAALLKLIPRQAHLEVSCLSPQRSALRYGFHYQPPRDGELHASLTLGELKELSAKRVIYRLKGLSQEEQKELWWRRGLVHALGDLALQHHPSLITRRFRIVNGWGEPLGGGAQNKDEWGFSRPEGMRNERLDWLTSLEEHLVPAHRLSPQGVPDNRERCQEFTKARALRESLSPDDAPLAPPRECVAFWRWAERTTTIELLLSAPSGEVVSSFGHLAFVTHDGTLSTPSVESPVYQFVGLVDTTGEHSLILMRTLLDELPITLNFESYLDYIKRNVDLEDRDVLHYTLTLTQEERIWLLAALWERLRRYHGAYSFTRHNCSSTLAQLLELSLSREEVERHELSSQLTSSPTSVISRLQRLGKLSLTPTLLSARSRRIQQLARTLQSSPNPLTLPAPTVSPTAQLKEWRASKPRLMALIDGWSALDTSSPMLIKRALSESQQLIEQLRVYLKLYDLEPWRSRSPVQERFAPVAPSALLEIKHELFHVERDAELITDRFSAWRQDTIKALPLSPSERRAREEAKDQQLRAEELTEFVEDLLIQVQGLHHSLLTHSPQLTPAVSAPPLFQTPVAQLSPRWGGDQSYELTLLSGSAPFSSLTQTLSPIGRLSVSLYDERLGSARHALFAGTRALTIAQVSLSATPSAQAISLTPFTFEGGPYSTWSLLPAFSLTAHLGHQLPRGGAQLEGYLGVGTALLIWTERRGQLTYHLLGLGGSYLGASRSGELLGRVRLLTPLWGPLTLKATLTHPLVGLSTSCALVLNAPHCLFEPTSSLTSRPVITLPGVLKGLRERDVTLSLTTPLFTQSQRALWLSLGLLPLSSDHVMSLSLTLH